jgi:hypothetical protein
MIKEYFKITKHLKTNYFMKYIVLKMMQSKHFLFLGLLLCLFSGSINAQTGVALQWDVEVGCQSYSEDPERKEIFLEDITDGVCLRVCESGKVVYTLTGPLGASPATVWSVAGGTITAQDSDSCNITWGATGAGSLTFTVNLPTGVVTKTLCFEKIIKPRAFFTRAPYTVETKYVVACVDQTINFVNYSTPNGGTALISYFWSFGDGTYSTAFNPSHMYTEPGSYPMTLTVTNGCNCSATYGRIVKIYEKGFDISCPTVVCEDQKEIYTLPEAVEQECKDHYNWFSAEGTINSVDPNTGAVTVTWDNVGPSGFGYLSFDPADCGLDCLIPTTIKVPVIQTVGTIVGDTNVCLNQQNIYKLPQWPTTDFHWEVLDNVGNSLAELVLSDQRNEVVVKPIVAGQIKLRCTYINTMLGCGGTATLVINVTAGQEFTGDFEVCNGTTGYYATTNGSPTNWTIKNPGGAVIGTASGTPTFSYSFVNAGGYTISVGGAGTCPEQVKNITVVPRPAAPLAGSLVGALTVCPNAPYIYSMPNDPTAQYHWAVTNGTPLSPVIGNSFTVSFNGTTPAQLVVYKESITPMVCPSLPVTIPITIKTIDAKLTAGNSCANNTASYQANQINTGLLYTDGETYNWSISPAALGSIISGQNTNTVNILWNNVSVTTSAVITLVITKCSLTRTLIRTIQITPTPIIEIIATPTASCTDTPFQFDVVSTNGVTLDPGSLVTWNFGFSNASGGLHNSFHYINTTPLNIIRNITAVITNPNGCGGTTNTASVQVEVYPGPSASTSITTGGNLFCLEDDINTILTAATATGATIQWYQGTTLLPGETNIDLDVSLHGFGEYYFIATSSNTCTTTSNSVFVSQYCPPLSTCVLNPDESVTNSSYNNCGILNLIGSATGSPSFEYFTIIGPTSISNYTQPTLNVSAGVYHVFYNAGYPCQTETIIKQAHEEVTVPYIPRFNYSVVCNNNASFTVSVLDNSDFFGPVDNRSFQYYYRLGTSGAWTTSITTANGTITPDLGPGNYQIRLVIQGDLYGNTQSPCEIILPMVLAAVPAQSIVVGPISCHDTAVSFDVSNFQSGDSYLWTFEPGAQNTLASPKRVFSSSGPKTVTVVITNKYGCTRTLTTTLTIPPPCFNGSITSPLTTVCLGSPVTLNYTPSGDNCAVANYTWMDGQEEIVGAANAASIQVYTPGFYWVNVKQGFCSYDTPQRITPTFKTPPSIKLTGPAAICQGEEVEVNAATSATIIRWLIDGVPYGAYNNLTTLTAYGLSVGSHTITATAYSGTVGAPTTCWESAQQTVVVNPTPNEPTITQQIFCVDQDPAMPYYHVILTATSNVTETFNWSNGMSGSPITVTNGGPYQVRVTSGGCSATAQIDVTKNLEDYIWIFPTGCVTQCGRKEGAPTLIGPRLPFTFWEWQYNTGTLLYGANSFPAPVQLNNSGTYNLALTQGDCFLQSPPLDYTVKGCEKCDIATVTIKEIKDEEQAFCSYQVTLTISSPSTYNATLTIQDNTAVVTPSAFTMLGPGTHDYVFTFYPIGAFAGGLVHYQINGVLPNGQPCINEYTIPFSSCVEGIESRSADAKEVRPSASVVLAPNPAKEQVTLYYKELPQAATVELYDLTGRNLAAYDISNSEGSLTMPTNNYPSGIYIVVVRTANGLISQQKLVLK